MQTNHRTVSGINGFFILKQGERGKATVAIINFVKEEVILEREDGCFEKNINIYIY